MTQKYKVFINNNQKVIIDNLQFFLKDHVLIEAAGGLVYNSQGDLLMIFRNNKWDLPKGKLEGSEDIQECAIREVKEECGLTNLSIVKELKKTYHTYKIKKQPILKVTTWYQMTCRNSQNLIPQIEEGITEVSWIKKEHLSEKIRNSYANIIELINELD
tara:strand:- start:868 stop:1344 length:477 start_codon:yes stop_codon:yes gene_type:complete